MTPIDTQEAQEPHEPHQPEEVESSGMRKPIPSWFIGVAVLITIAVTVWGFNTQQPERLPSTQDDMGWANQEILPVIGANNHFKVVAGVRGVPTITSGSRRPHGDRGPCTRCHLVVRPTGAPLPTLTADAWMPHQFRGMCVNCHPVNPPVFANGGIAAAAAGPGVAGGPNGAVAPAAPLGPPNNPLNLEPVWLGMEVAPITVLTGQQFATPPGIQGVVVTDVERPARTAGILAGDVVVAINGTQITDVASFAATTLGGGLQRGNVQILRGGKLVEVNLGSPAAMQPPPPAPVAQLPPQQLQPLPQQQQPAPSQSLQQLPQAVLRPPFKGPMGTLRQPQRPGHLGTPAAGIVPTQPSAAASPAPVMAMPPVTAATAATAGM